MDTLIASHPEPYHIILGLMIFVLGGLTIVISYIRNCTVRKVLTRETENEKEYEVIKPSEDWIWGHVFIFFILIWISWAIVNPG